MNSFKKRFYIEPKMHIFLYRKMYSDKKGGLSMRFQLVDPSYCITTDLTYHKYAIYEGVRAVYPNVSINIHRYYFEIEDDSAQIVSNLPLINEQIAARDPYLKSLFKPLTLNKAEEITVSPLLFTATK